MKLLTLNTHSLAEPDYPAKTLAFCREIQSLQPDLIALQEVNQRTDAPIVQKLPAGYHPCPGHSRPLRADNHALTLARGLPQHGQPWHWTWLPVKLGYDIYDEGLAIFSRRPFAAVRSLLLSEQDRYEYWKTRRALAVQLQGLPDWFCCVHMGWWGDAEEPFAAHFARLEQQLAGCTPAWLLGDFNADAAMRGEGYDLVAAHGWQDSYCAAAQRDAGFTVTEAIDGWQDAAAARRRIDQIWFKGSADILRSQVVFDGRQQPRVSDHAGVLVQTAPASASTTAKEQAR